MAAHINPHLASHHGSHGHVPPHARYAGKVVVVTGGSKGIGEAIVRVFTREGANVVFCARGSEEGAAVEDAVNALGGARAIFVQGDVCKPEDLAKLIQMAVGTFGKIDCLICNAFVTLSLRTCSLTTRRQVLPSSSRASA